jgi:pimeloyl-ACP methyl ester carboxylesterase
MLWLRWAIWPVLFLPALWWLWHALHAPPPAQTLENGARLEWVDCWFDRPLWRPVWCGRFHTAPEPGADPAVFELPVVYLPSSLWERAGPPVQYVAGGPGGAAWLDADEVGYWLGWSGQVGWRGGLVLYDQRGVGLSRPVLGCPELYAARRALLPLPLPIEESYRRVQAATEACHDRLRGEGVDLARFTTRHNARDAIDLMRAMGFEQWDLYGVSYGSRVALEMMRQAPEHLRAVVLDSVYPPEVNAELSDAWLLHRALALYSRICELAEQCDDSPEAMAAELEEAMQRVDRELIRLSVREPGDGRDLAVVYDRQDFAWLLFEAMYQWDAIPRLPGSVRALTEGRLDSHLRGLIQDSVSNLLDDSISDPVATSVDCHDAGPVPREAAALQLRLYPDVAAYKALDWEYHACRFWQSGHADGAFRSPVTGAVPTLLLAGEFDPVTPPEWAELAAKSLENASVFVFPAIGHGVLDSHLCATALISAFFEDPQSPQPPDCLDRL